MRLLAGEIFLPCLGKQRMRHPITPAQIQGVQAVDHLVSSHFLSSFFLSISLV